MQEQIKDLDRLLDIQEFCDFIIEHTPANEELFITNRVLQLGILKALENVGEAANQISKATQDEFKTLEWKKIIAARHVYVHDYFKIDWTKIWETLNTINFTEMSNAAAGIIEILKKRFSL